MLCTTISFEEMHDVVVCYARWTAANITVLDLLNSFYDIFRTCMSFIETICDYNDGARSRTWLCHSSLVHFWCLFPHQKGFPAIKCFLIDTYCNQILSIFLTREESEKVKWKRAFQITYRFRAVIRTVTI